MINCALEHPTGQHHRRSMSPSQSPLTVTHPSHSYGAAQRSNTPYPHHEHARTVHFVWKVVPSRRPERFRSACDVLVSVRCASGQPETHSACAAARADKPPAGFPAAGHTLACHTPAAAHDTKMPPRSRQRTRNGPSRCAAPTTHRDEPFQVDRKRMYETPAGRIRTYRYAPGEQNRRSANCQKRKRCG